MINIYGFEGEIACQINEKDLKIEHVLSPRQSTVTFLCENDFYPFPPKPEMTFTHGNLYTIKEVQISERGLANIVATICTDGLEDVAFSEIALKEQTIDEMLGAVLDGSGWTHYVQDVENPTKRLTVSMADVNRLDAIRNICDAFMVELDINAARKAIYINTRMGTDRGMYFMTGLNLKKIRKKTSSYDFYSRIIPIGANGLGIESVNDGKNYIENRSYAGGKIKTYIWKDESYTDAQSLKDDAIIKMRDLCEPAITYACEVKNLYGINPEKHSEKSFGLGDVVKIMDEKTTTSDKQRIVKYVEYPNDHIKDSVEMSNTWLTFEEMQARYQASLKVISNAFTRDGKISVSDILHFEEGIGGSKIIGGMQQDIGKIPVVRAIDKIVYLKDMTWARSSQGLYYSGTILPAEGFTGKILNLCIGNFGGLRPSDCINPYIGPEGSGSTFRLMSATNTFATADSYIIVRVLYS